MADQKPALVLHLASCGETLLFALTDAEAEKLHGKLAGFISSGAIESVTTKDESSVAINFGHVAAAYIDDLNRKSKVFGLHA